MKESSTNQREKEYKMKDGESRSVFPVTVWGDTDPRGTIGGHKEAYEETGNIKVRDLRANGT